MVIIKGFERGGVLKKYGVKKGDGIAAFDGFEYVDYLDYLFFDAKDEFDITIFRRETKVGGNTEIERIETNEKAVGDIRKGQAETFTIRNAEIETDEKAEAVGDNVEIERIETDEKAEAVGGNAERERIETNEKAIGDIRKGQAETFTIRIKKSAGQSMGAIFEDDEICPIQCRNKCIFCFVDQMKKGMRETLYVKDDDYRLSFISGNYVTLTNLSAREIDRIKRLKLSPLYVSVHAFDAEVRKKMLGNRFAGRLLGILKEFGEAGVLCHTQIVLVEGVNDGKILEETVGELYKLPSVLSVAIVPVGLTGYRGGLHKIEPLGVGCINKTIDFAESFAKKAKDGARGSAFVWCADEMYIRADRNFPPFEYYEDFCQIENGVGLAARFVYDTRDYFGECGNFSFREGQENDGECIKIETETDGTIYENAEKGNFSFRKERENDREFLKIETETDGSLCENAEKGSFSFRKERENDRECLKIETEIDGTVCENAEKKSFSFRKERENDRECIKIETVTGAAFYKIMVETAAFFEEKIKNIKIKVTKIKNNFFGESVTVAGLLTGADIAEQFEPSDDTDLVLIPKTMLKEFDDVFLDGMTVGELEKALGKKVAASPSDGYDLAEFLERIAVEGI
jgi:NifB/MoaA-like Fe-S oxidoreductase